MDDKTKIYLLLAVIFIFAILGFVGFFITIKHGGNNNSLQSQINTQEETINQIRNEIQSNNNISNASLKMGPQGVQGPIGPQGSPGGVYSGTGPLMCVGQKKVATPTYGVKESAIVYLDDKQHTPVQYWWMKNNDDGTVSIMNKFSGNCLTTNNLGDIFSDVCTNNPNQKFNWRPNMQLASISQQNQCLGVENYSRNPNNSNNSYNLEDMTVKRGSNNGNVMRLSLKACSASQNLDQTWWIGN